MEVRNRREGVTRVSRCAKLCMSRYVPAGYVAGIKKREVVEIESWGLDSKYVV